MNLRILSERHRVAGAWCDCCSRKARLLARVMVEHGTVVREVVSVCRGCAQAIARIARPR